MNKKNLEKLIRSECKVTLGKETIYVGIKQGERFVILKDALKELENVNRHNFIDPPKYDFDWSNAEGLSSCAQSILVDFFDGEKGGTALAGELYTNLIKPMIADGQSEGWVVLASQIYQLLGIDLATGSQWDKYKGNFPIKDA